MVLTEVTLNEPSTHLMYQTYFSTVKKISSDEKRNLLYSVFTSRIFATVTTVSDSVSLSIERIERSWN